MEIHRKDVNNKNEGDVTFEEAMDVIGTGYFQYKLTLISGIIVLTSYLTSNVVAFVLPVAQCDLHMSSTDKGKLASIFFVGLILTCHLWGFLSDTLGRRYVLLRCLIVDGLLYLVIMFTSNFYIILFQRFINGITSCGGVVSVYAYLSEFQTTSFKSSSLMMASFLASLAYVIMPAVAWLMLPAKWHFEFYPGQTIRPWKVFYMLCGVPSLISSLSLYFMPESPKFLLAKGKKDKVMVVLQTMYKVNHGKDCILPIKGIRPNEMEKIGKLDNNQNKVFAVVKLLWNQTVPLLKKPYRRCFLLLLVSFYSTVYSNNGLYVWLPPAINKMELYKSETGKQEGTYCDVLQYKKQNFNVNSNKLVYNNNNTTVTEMHVSELIVNEVTEETCNDEVDTSVYFIYLLLGAALTSVWVIVTIINRFVNKKYLMLGILLIVLSGAISMKISNDLITVPIKACIVIITSGSVFPILNTVVVDFFPTNLRAMAGCLAILTSRLGSITAHTISGFLIESRCDILIWLYIAVITVDILSISFIPAVPTEKTKNKQLDRQNEDA